MYRQAEEITQRIFEDLLYVKDHLQGGLTVMGYPAAFPLSDLKHTEKVLADIKIKLEETCAQLDPLYVVPVLVDACSAYYNSDEKANNAALGVAMKICLALVWKNTHSANHNLTKAYTILRQAVEVAMLHTAIENVAFFWEFEEKINITITPSGYQGNLFFWTVYTDAIVQGSKEYKTIREVSKVIWEDTTEFLEHLSLIVSGTLTSQDDLFKGSFLSKIPYSNFTFWGSIWINCFFCSK